MKALRTLQHDLQAYLLAEQALLPKQVTGLNAQFINKRLAIYKEAYHLRLIEILAADFPGVQALMGADLFEQICVEYIAAYPSHEPNPRYYGAQFAGFLNNHACLKQRLELAEMALFEWHLGLAEDAADTALLTLSDLQALPEAAWPELQFNLHPSVHFIKLATNVPQLWQATQAKQNLPALQTTESVMWTIWRHELMAYYHQHTELELCFLEAVRAKKNFAAICELLVQTAESEAAAQLAINFVLTFLNNQMFIKISV